MMIAMPTLLNHERVARQFRALGDEKRLRIVEMLRSGERCVCDLQDALDVGQSLLSFHLKTLREAELVRDRREGRWVYYTLNAEVLEEVEDVLRALRPVEGVGGGICCG